MSARNVHNIQKNLFFLIFFWQALLSKITFCIHYYKIMVCF